MASSIYRKYMWLVRTISRRRSGLTFDEINERWMQCSLNNDGTELPKRTFRNWLNAIGDTLGIDIACTKTSPYALKLSNRRWYLIVHSEERNRNYTYSLDRMVEVEETDRTFKMDKNYSVKRQFEHYVGVDTSVETPAETVRVKITGPMRDYITTLPLHHSQKAETEDKDFTIFRYHLIPNKELINALSSIGEDCEILEPQSLREQFRERAEKIAKLNK